jgi:hypothetical protein
MGWLGAFIAMLIGGGAGYAGVAASGVKAVGILGKGWGAGMAAAPIGGLLGGLFGLMAYQAIKVDTDAIRAEVNAKYAPELAAAQRNLDAIRERQKWLESYMAKRGL